MLEKASWIGCSQDFGEVCPEFLKSFTLGESGECGKQIKKAELTITAIGVYEARINGKRVGEFILAPGCTVYEKRLQCQTYDVTGLVRASDKQKSSSAQDASWENFLSVTVGTGWHRGHISEKCVEIHSMPCALLAELSVEYENGERESIVTDDSWLVRKSPILFSDIYDGEIYDGAFVSGKGEPVQVLALSKDRLIAQEGEEIREHERIKPVKLLVSEKGERILDFGQNFAGYVELVIDAPEGTKIKLSHSEILDAEGNFYRENYRGAKAELTYVCREGRQVYKPHFTFFGFRYLRLDEYPEQVDLNSFTGIVLYSHMERTGYIDCGIGKLNRFFENVIWSQRANFIDVPTDCPQRDERMGWTGDAQVFAKTACYNYRTEKFFRKWFRDICAEQFENGAVPDTVPNFWQLKGSSTAWGDVITIGPWQVYQTYGNREVLEENFEAMKKWVDYMTSDTLDQYLWTSSEDDKKLRGKHYGDWLGLDAPYGSYRGATDEDFIASAFYAYSAFLVVKTGEILGKDVSEYKKLYEKITETFKERFPEPKTQTEHVLALYFHLTDKEEQVAAELAEMVRENGNRLQTGFVGTPYLLYALSENGYASVAYDLLLQEECPSWLYEVNHGATTIWEHWDGVREDGTIWSSDMNSYNHYAYGAVMDWVYTVAAGIQTVENAPGFEQVRIAPLPDKRLGWLKASLNTKHGKIRSEWVWGPEGIRYEIETPSPAVIVIEGQEHAVEPGSYVFFGKQQQSL